jgi:alkanesulfonate monooxygenase SsuD/methylene tetrahydromethanopterin reductase-like flavin-dependent oxidoreductase (luciferase family)
MRERAARTDEALAIIDRVLRGQPVEHSGEHYEVHAHLRPASVQSPRPRIWIAATPPHRKPLERAARWDGVYCNVTLDELVPLRPEELRDYLGHLPDDPDRDVVTSPHPEHAAAEYEAVGVTWLVDSWWPGPGWLEQFRAHLGLRSSRSADPRRAG